MIEFNRTIESPGIETRELDLTLNVSLPVGTHVLVPGYASQGPTDEIINITGISELEQIFGLPNNDAERYFYHTCRQVLLKNGNLIAARLPYGEGDAYEAEYSALIYPVFSTHSAESTAYTAQMHTTSGEKYEPIIWAEFEKYNIDNQELKYNGDPIDGIQGFLTQSSTASAYYIGEPRQIRLTESEYSRISQGAIDWQDFGGVAVNTGENGTYSFKDLGRAGIIILNKIKKATNELQEGYYVILADNSKMGYGTDYISVQGFKTVLFPYDSYCDWVDVNEGVLNFELTGSYIGSSGTTSEIIESIPGFQFNAPDFDDSLVLGVMKLRTSSFASDGRTTSLDQILIETHMGSLNSKRKIQTHTGGTPENFYLEDTVNEKSTNIKVLINPWISKRSGNWTNEEGNIAKRVRIYTPEIGNYPSQPGAELANLAEVAFTQFKDNGDVDVSYDYGNKGYAIGIFQARSFDNTRIIGETNNKIDRILRLVENTDEVPLDIICEAGLSTINVATKVANVIKESDYDGTNPFVLAMYNLYKDWNGDFDANLYVPGVFESIQSEIAEINGQLIQQDFSAGDNIGTGKDSFIANNFQSTQALFEVFCEFRRRPGTLFISDPLRQLFVQGNLPSLECRDTNGERYNFPQHIYWGLRNLYSVSNTSYSCAYGNWVRSYDGESDSLVWIPFSGFAAGIMCDTDRNFFPWFAPAGLNRGRITDVVQLAVNPTQKQRDLLYRHNINPVVFFPQDGYVIWGQKTLFKKPSAFDRINVRRLFLVLQKATVAAARYFVFEPNTVFTRTRVVDALSPIFDRAKNNEGLYDYLIVCDERNNTENVIKRNELVIDIYLKPVRTAEFILISFIATRTGQDFTELI